MKKSIFSLCAFLGAFLFVQLPAFAEADDLPPTRDQGIWQTAMMIGVFLIFFYFILYRPEQKRRQAADEQRALIKKGDRVTAMGIIGTVQKVQDHTFILKMYDGSQIEVLKGAVTDFGAMPADDAKKDDKA